MKFRQWNVGSIELQERAFRDVDVLGLNMDARSFTKHSIVNFHWARKASVTGIPVEVASQKFRTSNNVEMSILTDATRWLDEFFNKR